MVTSKALLQVTSEPALTGAKLFAMWAWDRQVATFLVLEQLGLTGKDTPAPITSEMVALVVFFQSSIIWTIEAAPYLKAVFVGLVKISMLQSR